MTRVRVVSAAIALTAAIVLIASFQETGIAIIAALASVLSLIEFSDMALTEVSNPWIRRAFVFSGITAFLAMVFVPRSVLVCLPLATILMMTVHLWAARDEKVSLKSLTTSLGLSIWGMIYAGILPAFIYYLGKASINFNWFLFGGLVIFSGDIAAYFIGTKYGRTKLFKRISPNKSVEGAIASTFASAIVGLVSGYWLLPQVSLFALLLISLSAAAASQVGDLCESMLKRTYGTKDSGAVMPGHGGVLDRLDGTYFAAPVIYAYILWLT